MKTLADFKRDAASGKIKLEMVERFGKTGEEIPERCRGIRTIQSVNTVKIVLETADGLTSSLAFPPAKLIEYDGKSLTIYESGERDLTEQERKVLADWQKIEETTTSRIRTVMPTGKRRTISRNALALGLLVMNP